MKNINIILVAIVILIASNLKAQDLSTQASPLKVKELGIGLSNFNSFSLQYRWGNTKTLYRIGGNIGMASTFGNNNQTSIDSHDTLPPTTSSNTVKTNTPLNLTVGLNFSLLKLKPITEKFSFMYGGIIGVNYSDLNIKTTETESSMSSPYGVTVTRTTRTENQTTQSIKPYAGVVLGMSYQISEHFFIYAEISPNIFYMYSNNVIKITEGYYPPNTNTGFINNTRNPQNSFGIANLSNSGAMLTFVYRITN